MMVAYFITAALSAFGWLAYETHRRPGLTEDDRTPIPGVILGTFMLGVAWPIVFIVILAIALKRVK